MTTLKNILIAAIILFTINTATSCTQDDLGREATPVIEMVLPQPVLYYLQARVPAYGYDVAKNIGPIFGASSSYVHLIDREDAFRLYLGMDQVNGTFKQVEHRPAVSNTIHPEGNMMVSLANANHLKRLERTARHIFYDYQKGELEIGASLSRQDILSGASSHQTDYGYTKPVRVGVMGNYTMLLQKDEDGRVFVSYNDVWDLVPGGGGYEAAEDAVFNTFSVYGRIYMDQV